MKLKLKKEDIIDGLQKAAAIIPAKAGAAYLRSMWLKAEGETISFMATDANIEFTGTYPAKVEEPGLLGVPGRQFVDWVKRLAKGEFTVEPDNKTSWLALSQGRRSSCKLEISGPEWFQNFSEFPEGEPVIWSGDFFQEILDRVSFCISDDDAMEAINCLCLRPRDGGRIDACGLNGHQFAMVSFIHDQLCRRLGEKGVLIQKKYLQDIKKWLGEDEIELNFTDKRFYLRRADGAETLSVPLVGYEYPDYSVFLSRLDGKPDRLEISRQEGMDALDRIQVWNSDTDRCVYFTISPNSLEMVAQGAELGSGEEALDAEYIGSLDKIAFPTRNLLDIFSHFTSEKIQMLLTGAEGPCGIMGADDIDYTVIIMPMKVSESAYYTEE